jgi:Cys-rich repeat protein
MRTTLACLFLLVVSGCGTRTETYQCQPACPAGSTCQAGGCVFEGTPADAPPPPPGDLAATCSPACAAPTPLCDSTLTCVACLADSDCPSGQRCAKVGSLPQCVDGCADDSRCSGGKKCCGGACTDTASDSENCGACGMACSAMHAAATCQAGACAAGSCEIGWGDCNHDLADGCEANLAIDPANCQKCGAGCAFPHGGAACSNGCYLAVCSFGWDDCNGILDDGCETAVVDDLHNCGACGNTCVGAPHSRPTCQNASCQLASCVQGFSDCDGLVQNGCEVATGADKHNCGTCGNVCGNGLVCRNGSCTCVNCNFPNASSRCVNGACVMGPCLAGFADCNMIPKDGCEVDLNGDRKNCTGCGIACPLAQVCAGGMCVSGNCPPQAFATAGLPVPLNGSNGNPFGGAAFDRNGNLLVVSGFSPNNLYSVDLVTNAVTMLAALPGGATWVSVAYSPVDDTAYIGADSSDVIAYSFQSMMISKVTNFGVQSLNSLIVAPESFGAWGGQLLGGGFSGSVVAWDINNKVLVQVAGGLGLVSGMTASQAGVVYTSDYNNRRIMQIDAMGVVSQVAMLSGQSDGLAFDEARQRIYVADSGSARIHYVDLNNKNAVMDFNGNFSFDGGYWPSPIAFDCNSTVLVALNPAPTKISFATVP